MMTKNVIQSMIKWCNMGNPSAEYPSACKVREMMTDMSNKLSQICGVKITQYGCDNTTEYIVIYTSGASESNCTMIQSTVHSYFKQFNNKPHVIASSIEHKSILDCLQSLSEQNYCEYSLVNPTYGGHIRPEDVVRYIKKNTCLVCVMHANNETGAINQLSVLGELLHKYGIILYCDTVQTFGKLPPNPKISNIDGFCVSFHKLHGPPGMGALIIKKQIADNFIPIIYGSQNGGLRGGTENTLGLGASLCALNETMNDRHVKNKKMFALKDQLMTELSKRIPTRSYVDYVSRIQKNKIPEIEIIYLSNNSNDYLPNTLLLSVVKHTKPYVCNVKIKKELAKKNIIISVGSACNTSSKNASHVLYSMNADEFIRKGALRISLCDYNTVNDIYAFIVEFLTIIKRLYN